METNTTLSKIEIITRLTKMNEIKECLNKAKVGGMTITSAVGCGKEKGTPEYETKENTEIELLPKIVVSVVIESNRAREIIELVKKELYTGHIDDGKIFVYAVDNAIRIRTGEEGIDALY